jgi:TPR repeat protein
MRKLTATLCLMIAVLFGSMGMSASADFQKGLTAAQSGDFATALREWRPLAEQGNATAQFFLGTMYERGRGVPKNDKTAVKWYRLSAEQGNARAQYNLGVMYDEGQGVPQDYKTATKWYKLAAEQGYASAQTTLGGMYAMGKGVILDWVYAHMWGNLAASNGSETGAKVRDAAASTMTPSQLETAQKLTRECVRKKYKGC